MKRCAQYIILLLVICVFGACDSANIDEAPFSHESPAAPNLLSDALLLIETVEAAHPIFIFEDMLTEDYEVLRADFLDFAANSNSRTEFALAVQRYLTVLRDGHMSQPLLQGGSFISVDWTVQNSLLFLLDDYGQHSAEITAIGGVAVADIFAEVDRHFASENEFDRRRNHEIHARDMRILRMAGADIEQNRTTLTLDLDNEFTYMEIPLLPQLNALAFCGTDGDPEYIIRHEIMDDVFFISLRVMRSVGRSAEEVIEAVEYAVSIGMRRFIIDLRGNAGGNTDIGRLLFEAMGVAAPNFGTGFLRPSDFTAERMMAMHPGTEPPDHWDELKLALEQGLVGRDEIWAKVHSDIYAFDNPNNVVIAVLTDNYTYSAAALFAVYIQDSGLGIVVGEPSRQAPSVFGNGLPLQLPASRFSIPISIMYSPRLNRYADRDVLWPDIKIDSKYALEAALDFLRASH